MLYAARAALSEQDENARTHRGAWHLFHERYVASGQFDRLLFSQAQHARELWELGDYSAKLPTPAQTQELVDLAERFVAAVEDLLR
jgi:uncharacterized protein (UPF0332 family)